jgi:hypothetical protein
MKNNIETQQKHSEMKKQPYNNETSNETVEGKNNNHTTIVQQ